MKVEIPCALIVTLCIGHLAAADYTILHHFTGGTNDGASPYGSLVQSGSRLYGVTTAGGAGNKGTIFSMDASGSGFQLIHSFVSASSDGQVPFGELALSGSMLYGMASSVDTGYGGTLFRIGTDGSGFQVLRQFSGSDGVWPFSSPMLYGGRIYGQNTYGGSSAGWNGKGTIFAVNADGSDFQLMHTFAGGTNDGASPHGALIQVGTVLYGTASYWGSNDWGTIFSINNDGTNYRLLHIFTGGASDGRLPYMVTLVCAGSTLYGTTQWGGISDRGTVFSINTDGTGFRLLHSFAGGSNGHTPYGSLVLSGSTLYGMTSDDYSGTNGVIFGINTDGTGFHVLHRFAGGTSDGAMPFGALYLSDSMLYGMTPYGGSQNKGVIFAMDITPDTTPPTPDPLTWSVAPHGTGLHSISMTATTATDDSGVQYLFTCTSGGGHSSAWQNSPTYTDTGLAEGATCSYTVKARDNSPAQNQTLPSTPEASASTLLDNAAPTPDPMTWATPPAAAGLYGITMTAATASDVSGVEYFFQNITDANHSSGWQVADGWTDTGLVNGTTYAYQVKARDKSLAKNETLWSEPNSATTVSWLCTGPVAHDLNNDCRVDFLDLATVAMAWSTPLPLTNDIAVNGSFGEGITGWAQLDLPTATGTLMADWDAPYGNPPGAAYLMCDISLGDVDGHFLYQALPVTPGSSYRLSGQWMGDMIYSAWSPVGTENTRADIIVTFEPGTDPAAWSWTSPEAVMYRKVWGVANLNIDPNGIWNWEPFTSSPANGPADGVFTATDSYMVVAFRLAGVMSSTMPWFDIDNVKVEGPGCPTLDLNNDCSLDWLDVQLFATDWLACNRDPQNECWQ